MSHKREANINGTVLCNDTVELQPSIKRLIEHGWNITPEGDQANINANSGKSVRREFGLLFS